MTDYFYKKPAVQKWGCAVRKTCIYGVPYLRFYQAVVWEV